MSCNSLRMLCFVSVSESAFDPASAKSFSPTAIENSLMSRLSSSDFFRNASFRCSHSALSSDTGAPNGDIRELIGVCRDDTQGLAAAHRESGDRAVLAAGQHTELLFDGWDDLFHQFAGKAILKRRPRSRRLRRRNSPRCRRGHVRRPRQAAIGHHDQHRLRFSRGNQVVEDETRSADRAPSRVFVAAPVQQIQHRVLIRAAVVARRRIHVHPGWVSKVFERYQTRRT